MYHYRYMNMQQNCAQVLSFNSVYVVKRELITRLKKENILYKWYSLPGLGGNASGPIFPNLLVKTASGLQLVWRNMQLLSLWLRRRSRAIKVHSWLRSNSPTQSTISKKPSREEDVIIWLKTLFWAVQSTLATTVNTVTTTKCTKYYYALTVF